MERLPQQFELPDASTIANALFEQPFEEFCAGNPSAFRGRSVELEPNNVGDRVMVFFHETAEAITAIRAVFTPSDEHTLSRTGPAFKIMKDGTPPRFWKSVEGNRTDIEALLFANGEIEGIETTPEQAAD